MKYFHFLIIVFISFAAGCESGQVETYGDYTPIISEHDPGRDFKNDENSRIGFIVSQEADNRLSASELDTIVKTAFAASNTYGMKLLDSSSLSQTANASGLGNKLSSVRKNVRTGDVRADLAALGGKLGLTYILVVDITSSTGTETEISSVISAESTNGDFFWPSFSVPKMQTTGKASLEARLFSVSAGDFLQTYSSTPAIDDTYDTTTTYSVSQAMISAENSARRVENANRERITAQRIEQDAKTDKSFLGQLNVALSSPSDNNLSMITPLPFLQKKYKDLPSLFKAVYIAGFDALFTSYFSRYDGRTLSGDTVNGTGVFKFVSSDTCSGEWKEAQSNGFCEYTFKNGAKYAGNFSLGKAQGTGIATDSRANRYEGEFKNGLRNGTGTLYLETAPDQEIYIDMFGKVFIGQGELYANRDSLSSVKKLKAKTAYSVTAIDGRYTMIKEQKNAQASAPKSAAKKN